MKIHSRTVTAAVGLALVATVAALRQSAPDAPEIAAAGVAPVSFRHFQETQEADESGAPADQGETADASAQYAGEQDAATQLPQWQAITDHENARKGPAQPIPFNHRFHNTDLQIDCMYCHTGTERSGSGIVPPVDVCMGCHLVAGNGLPPVEELRAYSARGEPIPWKWVNKLPEFVQFSHQPHLRNGLECAECHGPVEEMDRVYQWAPFTMGWCLECHRSAPADTDISTDHALSEMNPPPTDTRVRQEGSFYPSSIDTQYGASRAPTDCAACHH